MTPDLLQALDAARAAKRPVVLATRLPDGAQILLPDAAAPAALAEAAARALVDEVSGTAKIGNETWFLQVHLPPARLIVVGAVHIAQALVPMALPLGLAVTMIDPRRSFATPERFPGVTISTDWPDEAMAALAPDVRTAVVTLTHDPKLDDPALDAALRSPVPYIGALGSRRTHARRLERLASLGHDAATLARIRGPVGLNLGAVSAAEIALSILAELTAVRHHAPIAGGAGVPGAKP